MIRINGSALISLGEILQDLLHVKPQQPAKENLLPLLGGGLLLANFLDRDNAFQLRVSQKKGQELQQCLDKLGQKKLPDELNHTDVAILTRLVNEFQMIVKEELNVANLYLVLRKRGYSTEALIESPSDIFPNDLLQHVPDAAHDVEQVGRCLAFEVPTAAAFHLNRINEAVLRRYFAAIAPKEEPPKSGNMGVYLSTLEELLKTMQKPSELQTLIPLLRNIKDQYRNPIMHPDLSIGSIDQSFALLDLINTAVGLMPGKIVQQSRGTL